MGGATLLGHLCRRGLPAALRSWPLLRPLPRQPCGALGPQPSSGGACGRPPHSSLGLHVTLTPSRAPSGWPCGVLGSLADPCVCRGHGHLALSSHAIHRVARPRACLCLGERNSGRTGPSAPTGGADALLLRALRSQCRCMSAPVPGLTAPREPAPELRAAGTGELAVRAPWPAG